MERQQQMERQLRLMEYVEALQEAAHEKGLYFDHYSDDWQNDGTKDGSKKLTFFVWDHTGSISESFHSTYTYTTWRDIKVMAPMIINSVIEQAFAF